MAAASGVLRFIVSYVGSGEMESVWGTVASNAARSASPLACR